VEVLGEIEDDGDIAALTGETGAGSAGEDGGAELATGSDGCLDVCGIERHDEADRDLPVVGGVGCVESAGSGVEANLAADRGVKQGFESLGVVECFVRMKRWLDVGFRQDMKRRRRTHQAIPHFVPHARVVGIAFASKDSRN